MSGAHVITFYSFKGGVGRTQALANVAVALANQGKRVILLDMDMESPGLPLFFRDAAGSPLSDDRLAGQPGLLDYLEACQKLPATEPPISELLLPVSHPQQRHGSLRLLTVGRTDGSYPERITAFSWERFYQEQEGFRYLELLRQRLCQAQADFVLIDSRTGMTDIGAVCTFQLPDLVVVLFALHQQGIHGARRIAQAIARNREDSEFDEAPPRPRSVLLVPSRVEEISEIERRNEWLQRARDELAGCGAFLAEEPSHLPYVPYWAFGESIAVRPEGEGVPDPLSQAYERLTHEITQRCGETSSVMPRKALRSPLALRKDAAELTRTVAALQQDLNAFAASRAELPALRAWGSKLQHAHETFLQDLQRIQGDLSPFLTRFPTGRSASLEAPRTAAEWDSACTQLTHRIDEVCAAWRRQRQEELRARLVELSEGDEEAAQEHLQPLLVLLDEGDEDALSARLPALEKQLREESLLPQLRGGRLDAQRLAERIRSPERRRDWLERQIGRLAEEGAAEEATARQLLTLLALRLNEDPTQPPERAHYDAYDIACTLWPEQDPQLFPQVGAQLWSTAWQRYFAAPPGQRDPLWPMGPASREQLLRVAKEAPQHLSVVSDTINEGLQSWPMGKADWHGELAILFESRQDDPCLKRALRGLGNRPGRADLNARLLALWLSVAPVEHEDQAAYLAALQSSNYLAEAFYALCAYLQEHPDTAHDPRWDGLLFEYITWVVRDDKLQTAAQALEPLLSDEAFIERLWTLKAGRALVALWVGFLQDGWSWPSAPRRAVHERLLRERPDEHLLPTTVWFWLEQLRRIPDALEALQRAAQVRPVHVRLLELQEETFHQSWGDSARYEAEFKLLVAELLPKVLRARGGEELEAAQRLVDKSGNADDWMNATYTRLIAKNPRVRRPDGAGRKKILDAFRRLHEGLLALMAMQRSGEALQDLVELGVNKERARDALVFWLKKGAGPLGVRLEGLMKAAHG